MSTNKRHRHTPWWMKIVEIIACVFVASCVIIILDLTGVIGTTPTSPVAVPATEPIAAETTTVPSPTPTPKPSPKPRTPKGKIAAAVKAELTPPARLWAVVYVRTDAANETGVGVLL